MGFTGHVNGKFLKSMFSIPYKFLIHCIMHALSHWKGAYDELSDYIMNIITCLVLNRPYNISQVLFDHLVDNIRGEKFIMYPRFMQMMINDQVTDLPKDPADVVNLRNMKSDTLSRLGQYKGLKKDESESRARRMNCKINNPSYVAPENDAWRRDNSNSEDETERPSELQEKKLRYWFVKDGKRKRTPKASPTVTTPKVSTPKIVIKDIGIQSNHHQGWLMSQCLIHQKFFSNALVKETLEGFLKKNEEATVAQGSNVEKVDDLSMNVQPEGVAHTDSSDADDESTGTESEIEKIGVGKVQLMKKPQKNKAKGSDEEDSTYTPTAEEKKKIRIKRKAVQTGIIPRNVRAKKGSATMPEVQSGKKEKHVIISKDPETVKNAGDDDDDDVVITEERMSTPPPPPENPDVAETSKPKKTVLPDPFEGFPNIRGELKDEFFLNEEYDMFHDATVKDLKKKVSILEKEKEKAEADRDELKKQLEETKVNEEIKSVIIKYAKKIKTLKEDVDDNAKLFEQLSMEITDLHLKKKNLNETNQTRHQMLQELHEASASEIKVLNLEIGALRADKIVKDEQLNMLYTRFKGLKSEGLTEKKSWLRRQLKRRKS
ncbi:hypothetical protein Hanom_Chr13g01214391 [Helianthus anomalus]